MNKRDYENYDIESRIRSAMKTMKVIEEFSNNDIEKHQADYCFHKLENLLNTSMALAYRTRKELCVNCKRFDKEYPICDCMAHSGFIPKELN